MTSVSTAQPTEYRGAFGDFCIGAVGFFYAIAIYYIPVSITGAVLADIGNAAILKAAILIQFVVGLVTSAVAYFGAWDRSFVLGMRVCYTLVVGFVAAFGAYSILGSF
jgi:hypothetical protein